MASAARLGTRTEFLGDEIAGALFSMLDAELLLLISPFVVPIKFSVECRRLPGAASTLRLPFEGLCSWSMTGKALAVSQFRWRLLVVLVATTVSFSSRDLRSKHGHQASSCPPSPLATDFVGVLAWNHHHLVHEHHLLVPQLLALDFPFPKLRRATTAKQQFALSPVSDRRATTCINRVFDLKLFRIR
jgi:hypothetical protein